MKLLFVERDFESQQQLLSEVWHFLQQMMNCGITNPEEFAHAYNSDFEIQSISSGNLRLNYHAPIPNNDRNSSLNIGYYQSDRFIQNLQVELGQNGRPEEVVEGEDEATQGQSGRSIRGADAEDAGDTLSGQTSELTLSNNQTLNYSGFSNSSNNLAESTIPNPMLIIRARSTVSLATGDFSLENSAVETQFTFGTCNACNNAKSEQMLLPCGHSFCNGCSSRLHICPVCQRRVISTVRPNCSGQVGFENLRDGSAADSSNETPETYSSGTISLATSGFSYNNYEHETDPPILDTFAVSRI